MPPRARHARAPLGLGAARVIRGRGRADPRGPSNRRNLEPVRPRRSRRGRRRRRRARPGGGPRPGARLHRHLVRRRRSPSATVGSPREPLASSTRSPPCRSRTAPWRSPTASPGPATCTSPAWAAQPSSLWSANASCSAPPMTRSSSSSARPSTSNGGFAMGAMRDGGALGEAPLDAGFAVPPSALGAQRIERAVAASDAERSPQRCPFEDPGHTVACSFGWSGSVVLERTDGGGPQIRRRALARGVSSASVEVICRARVRSSSPSAGARRPVDGAGQHLGVSRSRSRPRPAGPSCGRGRSRRQARVGAPHPFGRPRRASGAPTRRHR